MSEELLKLRPGYTGAYTIIEFNNERLGHGGFDVRQCPKNVELAALIVHRVNTWENLVEKAKDLLVAVKYAGLSELPNSAGKGYTARIPDVFVEELEQLINQSEMKV